MTIGFPLSVWRFLRSPARYPGAVPLENFRGPHPVREHQGDEFRRPDRRDGDSDVHPGLQDVLRGHGLSQAHFDLESIMGRAPTSAPSRHFWIR